MICLGDIQMVTLTQVSQSVHAQVPEGAYILWQGPFLDGALRYFTLEDSTKVHYLFTSIDIDFWGTITFDPTKTNMDTFVDNCNDVVRELYFQNVQKLREETNATIH